MDKSIISQYRQKLTDELFSSVLPFWENMALTQRTVAFALA